MTRVTSHWRFCLVTGATVLAVALTASLGLWQLNRAAQKERLAEQRSARQALPALNWSDLLQANMPMDLPEMLDRQVELEGYWKHEATVFLDNRPLNGRAGFWVVTPLWHEGRQQAVLVTRGWVPRRLDDRTAVPSLDASSGLVRVKGRLAPPPSKLYDFGQAGQGRIRQNIDIDAFAAEWSLKLWPVSVQQLDSAGPETVLSRDWPLPDSDVHQHYGYAVQWFGLTLLLIFLYVWFQCIGPWRQRRASRRVESNAAG